MKSEILKACRVNYLLATLKTQLSLVAAGFLCPALISGEVAAAQLQVPSQYATIQMAIEATNDGDTIILAPGRYNERVVIKYTQIAIRGDGDAPSDTVIVGRTNTHDFAHPREAAVLLAVQDINLSNLTIKNSFDEPAELANGGKSHTIAARFEARVNARNVYFIGWSDVLNINGDGFFDQVKVLGTNDFIYGLGNATFYRSVFVSRGKGSVFAHGGDQSNRGFVIIDSKIVRQSSTTHQYFLARPWKSHSTVRIINSFIGSGVYSQRYNNSWEASREDTLHFFECNNRGLGASTAGAVSWMEDCL